MNDDARPAIALEPDPGLSDDAVSMADDGIEDDPLAARPEPDPGLPDDAASIADHRIDQGDPLAARPEPDPGFPDGAASMADDGIDQGDLLAARPEPMPEPDGPAADDIEPAEVDDPASPRHRRLRIAGIVAGGLCAAAGAAGLVLWFAADSRPPSLSGMTDPAAMPGAAPDPTRDATGDAASPREPVGPTSQPASVRRSSAAPASVQAVSIPEPAAPAANATGEPIVAPNLDTPIVAPATTPVGSPDHPATAAATPASAGTAPAVPAAAPAATGDAPDRAGTDAPLAALQNAQDRLFRLRLQRDEARLRAEICQIATARDRPDWCAPAAPRPPRPTAQQQPADAAARRPAPTPASAAAPTADLPPLAAVVGRPGALVAVFLGDRGPLERRAGDALGAWRIDRIDSDGRVRITGPGGAVTRRAGR